MMHTATDNIALVAPRPVRLPTFSHLYSSPHRSQALRLVSAPADTLKLVDEDADDSSRSHTDRDGASASPRASSRSSLPSEALEEFLSILRPALFPPQSPTLRARRYPITSIHDRSLSLSSKPLERLDNVSLLPRDDPRTPVKQLGNTLSPRLRTPLQENNDENDALPELAPRLSGSGPLASPISRVHTRNPFQRHPSYEAPMFKSGGPLLLMPDRSPPPQTLLGQTPYSPTMVPLPSPTPSEMDQF
ncbi:hypothetical protein FA95DRAFT_1591698 [Auriscalpium vulgare]|uniref:Uncharacterized protein n=1 Tax=Auriscalpium vulgare TaxID=40419 RepID=A0ACB8SB74_9AGAM|nr:hypothetical protein FA95DRAFT_1591698 [Auriscalpium vulgare]